MRLIRTKYLLPVAAAALALSACGSDPAPVGTGAPSSMGSTKANTFVLDEWSVMPPAADIKAGKVAVTAKNVGTEIHEVVFVRAADVASLPIKADGSVDEDKFPESKKAGEIADLAAGKSATKTLDLPAGDYVAFCNLVEDMGKSTSGTGGMGSGNMGSGSGMNSSTSMGGGMSTGSGMHHVHYQQGMVTTFTVT